MASPGRVALCAVDLDQTLVYSRRSSGRVDAAGLTAVEELDGRAISFLTREAADLLAGWPGDVLLVPVTTRSLEQYRRVRLPVATPYAVAANGGHLLVDGRPDPAWAQVVAARVAPARPAIEVLSAVTDAAAGWARTVRMADGLFVYAVAAADELPRGALSDVERWLEQGGWRLSRQGRKAYATPVALTKEAAVAEVRRRAGGALPVLAAGDSLLDLGLLRSANHAIRPAHGELATVSPEGVAVTAASGAGAAAELLRWMLALAGHREPSCPPVSSSG